MISKDKIKLWKPLEVNDNYIIKPPPQPVGYLYHKNTHTTIPVYKNINWFKSLLIKWCFDLKYNKLK